MALHKKWNRLTSLRPDVAIIPECADPNIIGARRKAPLECDSQWVGDNLARAYRNLARNEDSQREMDRAKALAPSETDHWDCVVESG
jgi:hypothetical protein